jgi:hypothetical protein
MAFSPHFIIFNSKFYLAAPASGTLLCEYIIKYRAQQVKFAQNLTKKAILRRFKGRFGVKKWIKSTCRRHF